MIAAPLKPDQKIDKNEDEWFYILDSTMTFHVESENHSGTVGAFVCFPRGIPHTFTVESPTARFLLMNTPGGFERMFELAPRTVDDAVKALRAYDVEVVRPHPKRAASTDRERSSEPAES